MRGDTYVYIEKIDPYELKLFFIKPPVGKSCVKRATHHALESIDYFGSLNCETELIVSLDMDATTFVAKYDIYECSNMKDTQIGSGR